MVRIPDWPPVPLWHNGSKINLDNSFKLLNQLEDPHLHTPPIIHIAGTNGKGSSVAMLKSIFMRAGLKVHTYTSPHLINYNERIVLAGKQISDIYLYELLAKVRLVSDKLGIKPSFFEGTTAAAFLAFAEQEADVLILETGLGGRLDCTNVITAPAATVITPISLDHMEVLGSDIIQIAAEKAGIIKKSSPCIIGPQVPEVYEVLLKKCEEVGAPAFCYEYDFGAEQSAEGFRYISQMHNIALPRPNLLGDHQITNAATIVATVLLLNNLYQVTTGQISTGLVNINWPGRIQKIDRIKVNAITNRDNVNIYLDGAHNDAGAMCLSNWMEKNLSEDTYLIFGMTGNRNAASFFSYFSDKVKGCYTVRVESEPSSYSCAYLADLANNNQHLGVKAMSSLDDAIKQICASSNGSINIVVTGSLFLIADFMQLYIA